MAVCGLHDRADRTAAVLAGALCVYGQEPASDAAEFCNAVHQPRLPRPAADHRDYRHHLGSDLLHRRRTDRMAGVAHRHAGTADHPRAGDGLVRDAAVSRRRGLGVAGGAEQRFVEPALSLPDRRRSGFGSVQYLFVDRHHLRHLLLHVSVRVRAGRQRARQHAGRTRRRLRHPWRQGLDHGATHHHSAGAAGAGRRRADRLPAGHDTVRIARDPGAAGRLSHHDHENLEPVPISAEARARSGCRGAAAGADDIAAAGPKVPARPPRLFGGRRQIWRAAPDRTGAVALGCTGVLPDRSAQPRVPALSRSCSTPRSRRMRRRW